MKRFIEAWLLRSLIDPPLARVLDLPKTATVIKGFTHEGRSYHGVDDWFEIESEGKRGQVTRAMLGQSGDTIVALGSVMRDLRQKGLVQLVCDETLESGPYTVFDVENGVRGFRPWDKFEQSHWEPALAESEFDDVFVPVRRLQRKWPKPPTWSGLFFLPWLWVQNAPLVSEGTEPGTLAIDLSSSLEARHQRMVAGAY
jgi:hypothetical protein